VRTFITLLTGLVLGLVLSLVAFLYRNDIIKTYKVLNNITKNIISNVGESSTLSPELPSYLRAKVINTSYFPLSIRQSSFLEVGDRRISSTTALNNESFLLFLNDGTVYFSKITEKELSLVSNLYPSNYPENALRKVFRSQLSCETNSLYTTILKQNEDETGHFVVQKSFVDCQGKLTRLGVTESLYESEAISLEKLGSGYQGGGALLLDGQSLYFSIGFSDLVGTKSDVLESVALEENNIYGKTFKIDLQSGDIDLFTKGHRNLQDLTLLKDDVVSIEHGPQGGDELNILAAGTSYGWPEKTFGTIYGAFRWHNNFRKNLSKNSINPIYAFVPSIAPSSVLSTEGTFLDGRFDLVIGGLKSQSIFLTKLNQDRVIYIEPVFLGLRVRDIEAIGDRLLIVTDEGYLLFVEIDEIQHLADVNTDRRHYRHGELKVCSGCHSFESGVNGIGPSLNDIFGRKVGKYPNFSYTSNLAGSRAEWDKALLQEYILNPNKVYPGTDMPNLNLSKKQVKKIADLLELY
jgi:cytochrome c2